MLDLVIMRGLFIFAPIFSAPSQSGEAEKIGAAYLIICDYILSVSALHPK